MADVGRLLPVALHHWKAGKQCTPDTQILGLGGENRPVPDNSKLL